MVDPTTKYLFDTNSLSGAVLVASKNYRNFFILEEVMEEWVTTDVEYRRLLSSGLTVLSLSDIHLETMKKIMAEHGKNLGLIRLYTGKGTADIAMLAYVLGENETGGMLPPKWVLVTEDRPLRETAQKYGISCESATPLLQDL